MTKEQAKSVKIIVDRITGKNYTKTYASKSGTLHIRVATYIDSVRETEKEWIATKETEREQIIEMLKAIFPEFTVEKNNKRYQGFINDICITIN